MVKSVANRPNGVKRTGGVGYPVRRIYNKVILLLTGLFFTFMPCAGQSSGSGSSVPDSLYRSGTPEVSAGFSCRVMYSQGSGVIVPYLGNNAAELEKLDQFVRQALSHPTRPVFRLRLTGYSSIEGSYARNESLARERVASLYIYLRERYPELYRYSHDRAWVAEDWDSLTRLIRESPLNNREEVLEIIRKVPVYDTRETLLTTLDGGYPWLFMQREVFAQLRRAEVQITIDHSIDNGQMTNDNYRVQPTASPQPNSLTPALSKGEGAGYSANDNYNGQLAAGSKQVATTVPVAPGIRSTTPIDNGQLTNDNDKAQPTSTMDNGQLTNDNDKAQPTVNYQLSTVNSSAQPTVNYQLSTVNSSGEGRGEAFVLKTNLLLLAGVQPDFTYTTPVLNGALEYYISDHWSVEAGAAYSYWQYHSRQEFQGVSGYRLEPRYRLAFPNDRFGAYLGAYGRFGDYDIRKTKISVDRGNPVDDNYDAQPATGSERPSTFSFTGRYWDAGLSAGFTVRLVGGLGLEVGARAGYVRSSPKEYIYRDGQKWFDSHWKYHRMGVTDLNLSITYTIDK